LEEFFINFSRGVNGQELNFLCCYFRLLNKVQKRLFMNQADQLLDNFCHSGWPFASLKVDTSEQNAIS